MALTKAEPEHLIELKETICTGLGCVVNICSFFSNYLPIFGTVGTVAKNVLAILDDRKEREAIGKLKTEFDSLNNHLDQLWKQGEAVLKDIKKAAVDAQLNRVIANLNNQFRSFMEMTEAKPEHFEKRKEDFIKRYKIAKSDQNLQTLYESVMGHPKAFHQGILEVYMEHSGSNRDVMEQLCKYIISLFIMGLLPFMSHATLRGLDVEKEEKKWTKNLQDVQEKMEETLSSCKVN
uniref:Rapunzel 2 n=1 Tax=Neogobius melanostomus TaxID=47308 RepID=A0A8C6UHM5_9GOBI